VYELTLTRRRVPWIYPAIYSSTGYHFFPCCCHRVPAIASRRRWSLCPRLRPYRRVRGCRRGRSPRSYVWVVGERLVGDWVVFGYLGIRFGSCMGCHSPAKSFGWDVHVGSQTHQERSARVEVLQQRDGETRHENRSVLRSVNRGERSVIGW